MNINNTKNNNNNNNTNINNKFEYTFFKSALDIKSLLLVIRSPFIAVSIN